MSRVLVTGGAGFIGRALVSRLANDGHKVVVLDDLSTGMMTKQLMVDAERVVVDTVLHPKAFPPGPFDHVYHLASVVGQVRAKNDPSASFRVSVEGAVNLLAQEYGCTATYLSSSAVYGTNGKDSAGSMYNALAYDGGRPGYACGKYTAEMVLADDLLGYLNIVRPFNVTGPGQTGKYGMVLPRFLQAAAAGKAITVYGDGEQRRTFAHIDTFIDTLVRYTPDFSCVDLGSPDSISINELAELVIRVTGRDVPIVHVPYHSVFPGATDVMDRAPDLDWISRHGYEGPEWPSIEQIVRDMWEAMQR